jgi:hypothetical protein
MFNALRLRSAAALASSLAAAVLLSAAPVYAQEGPGPEELAALAAAPALAAPAPTGLPREVLEAAGAYRAYMRQTSTVSSSFADGPSIARALKVSAAYEPKQLLRGAIGFAAVAALQDRDFVDGVRQAGADPARRAALVDRLVRNPASAAALPGADLAAGRVTAVLGGEGERVHALGVRVKQAAYDVQRQGWSKAEVSARVERLAEVKALSAQPLTAAADDVALLQRASLGEAMPLPAGSPEPASRPVVARGLAVAALAVLNEASPTNLEPLLADPECASCLRMSKLNLFQCLAVAKPWYEDVFCLGQHVLMDTGACFQAAAGPRRLPAALPTTLAAAPPAPRETAAAASPPAAISTVAALR